MHGLARLCRFAVGIVHGLARLCRFAVGIVHGLARLCRFALVVVGSEHSSRTIFDRLSRKELHGQILQVTHHTKQAFNQFEAQARKGGEQPPNGTFRERDRDRDRDGQCLRHLHISLPVVSWGDVE